MGYALATLGALNASTTYRLDQDVVEDLYFQITGVFSGTLTFSLSLDGTTFDTLQLLPTSGGAGVTAVTTTGSFRTAFGLSYGAQLLKVQMTAYTSGAAVLNIRAMAAGRS
jgi:hypothetical protein